MKALDYLVSKNKRPVLLRAFHIWQRRPHEVKPLSETTHECSSCGTAFQGNFCPRCGQAASVGRFSFKKAMLLFLDVWGVGNRGMFRSLRDLMLRPGYMIRDYLRGMQSAYFPPFKMFFLLMAFSLLVDHGFSFGMDEAEGKVRTVVVEKENTDTGEREQAEYDEMVESPLFYVCVMFAETMNKLRKSNPAIFALLSLLLFAAPLYFFLRSSPAIPDLRYSEFVVLLVYTSNTFSIYSIVGNLLNSGLLKLIAVMMVFVALKQFSGYSKLRLFKYIALTVLVSALVLTSITGLGIYVAYLYYR